MTWAWRWHGHAEAGFPTALAALAALEAYNMGGSLPPPPPLAALAAPRGPAAVHGVVVQGMVVEEQEEAEEGGAAQVEAAAIVEGVELGLFAALSHHMAAEARARFCLAIRLLRDQATPPASYPAIHLAATSPPPRP